jgi:hypothetical protein
MSVWRQKAIECLPELKKDFERPDTTIYTVFFELLPATREAHKNKDNEKLQKYYGFAEWCFMQKNAFDLCNAAGVSFYEHLGNYEETFLAMPKWVNRDIYDDIRGLLKLMLEDEKMKKLDYIYSTVKRTNKAVHNKVISKNNRT